MLKTILVTGADGFSARHLLPLLRRDPGIRLVGISLGPAPAEEYLDRSHRGDILDLEFLDSVLRSERPEQVYHLAAVVPVTRVRSDFPRALRVNVEGTYLLLEGIFRHVPSARVLVVGSSDEYGRRHPEEMPLKEADSFSPANEYGVTKVAQELLARVIAKERGIPVLFTRTFNFTGPGQPADFFCAAMAEQVSRCMRAGGGTIRTGNLDVERDFLDIRDAVGAYRIIMGKGEPGCIYNVCSGEPVSLRRILGLLIGMSGVSIRVEQDETRVRKVDIPYLAGCNDRLRGLGWRREHTLEGTLRDLLAGFGNASR